MSRRRTALVVGGILGGAVLLAFLLVWLRPEPPRSGPPPQAPLVRAESASVRTGPLPVRGSGTVRPRAQVELAPRVSGEVVWVSPSFVTGGRVGQGDLLLRIDPSDYRNAVEQARADVAQQQVAVLQAEEEARIAEVEYEQFLQRQARLRARTGEPVSPVDSAAQASRLVLREPQLEAARAALQRARAALADAELSLERTEIRAPFDAVVRTESIDVGGYAAAGQTLAELFATGVVEVVVPFTDRDASLIPDLWELEAGRSGTRVPARVLADFGGRVWAWEGYVDRAEASLDEESRTVDVVVRVPDPLRPGTPGDSAAVADAGVSAPPLLVGQFVDVDIRGAEPGEYVVVPRPALRPGDEVWALRDGRVEIVPVRVLQEVENDVYLLGAIEAGQPVVVGGLDVATDGMRVRTAGETVDTAAAAGEAGDTAGSGDAGQGAP